MKILPVFNSGLHLYGNLLLVACGALAGVTATEVYTAASITSAHYMSDYDKNGTTGLSKTEWIQLINQEFNNSPRSEFTVEELRQANLFRYKFSLFTFADKIWIKDESPGSYEAAIAELIRQSNMSED